MSATLRPILVALSVVAFAGAAQAQVTAALPTDPAQRAIACAAALTAVSASVRSASAAMADELDGFARRWRLQATAANPDAERQITEQVAALTGASGLPGGTFDKAAVCQNEAAGLPAG
jgi:hypothetical protein